MIMGEVHLFQLKRLLKDRNAHNEKKHKMNMNMSSQIFGPDYPTGDNLTSNFGPDYPLASNPLSAPERVIPFGDSFNDSSLMDNLDNSTQWLNSTGPLKYPHGGGSMFTPLPNDMVFNDGHVILISCYSAIFAVSLIGNLCVLRAILGGDGRNRKVNMMLLHLAIADLIVTTVMIPVEIGWAATVQWTAGDALCRIFAFFRIFGHYLSSFVLVCISIDRYFAVVHPLSMSTAATLKGKVMLGFSWLLAFVCSLPQVVIFHVDNHPVHSFYQQCVTFGFFPTPYHEMAYNLFCLAMLYLFPLSVIVVSYSVIVATIFQKSKLSLCDGTTIRRSGVGYLEKARVRTLKMTISIVFAFFICWTPYVVISLWFCFDPFAASLLDIKIQKALFVFACTNSCANPLVYGIFNFCRKAPKRTPTWKSSTQTTRMTTASSKTASRSLPTSPTMEGNPSAPLNRQDTIDCTELFLEAGDLPTADLLPTTVRRNSSLSTITKETKFTICNANFEPNFSNGRTQRGSIAEFTHGNI